MLLSIAGRARQVHGSDFEEVTNLRTNLEGVNLTEARDLHLAHLRGIKFDEATRWPEDFKPKINS
jgi:uncharacterized protein YjbI with pentapeptide repeats